MVAMTRSKCGSNTPNMKSVSKKGMGTTLYLDQAMSSCSSSSSSSSDSSSSTRNEEDDLDMLSSTEEEEEDDDDFVEEEEEEEDVDGIDGSLKPSSKEGETTNEDGGDEETTSSDTEGSWQSDEDDCLINLPKEVMTNQTLKKTYDRIKDHIATKRTPDLCKILKSRIKFQQKVDLFELYVLYDNAEPYTEEHLGYREALVKLLPVYQKEYKHNTKYSKRLKLLEKRINILDDVSLWPSKIVTLPTSEQNKETIFKKYNELKNMSREDEEYGRLERWMKVALSLPYDVMAEGTLPVVPKDDTFSHLTEYLMQVKKQLDDKLYGMNDVKEQILLFLHMKLQNPSLRGCCLGLIGVPGCGKTTIARCLSDILKYPFQQISFGGINNSEFLKGYHYTYVGSRPGEIVNCVTRMKASNGILFFDEYDKVTQNADIISTLLHITDFSQNNSFRDNYLCDLEIDLSKLWFIYSMNELPENSALRDRIFPIFIEGYNLRDKIRIIVDYLFPNHLSNVKLKKTDVLVSDEVAVHIINKSQLDVNDKGVRTIEKAVKDIVHKLSFILTHQSNAQDFSAFSFFGKTPLSIPLTLSTEIVNCCLSKFKSHIKDNHVHNMYL